MVYSSINDEEEEEKELPWLGYLHFTLGVLAGCKWFLYNYCLSLTEKDGQGVWCNVLPEAQPPPQAATPPSTSASQGEAAGNSTAPAATVTPAANSSTQGEKSTEAATAGVTSTTSATPAATSQEAKAASATEAVAAATTNTPATKTAEKETPGAPKKKGGKLEMQAAAAKDCEVDAFFFITTKAKALPTAAQIRLVDPQSPSERKVWAQVSFVNWKPNEPPADVFLCPSRKYIGYRFSNISFVIPPPPPPPPPRLPRFRMAFS